MRPATFISPAPSVQRAAFGIGVLVFHAIALAVILRMTLLRPAETAVTPILVSFVEQALQKPAAPPPSSTPELALVQTEVPVLPDLPTPVDAQTTAITIAPTVAAPPAPDVSSTEGMSETPLMSEIAYVKEPAPRYPPESRVAREEGLVLLRVLVDEDGHARRIDVLRSSGHPRLDRAACSAVEHARFKPFMRGGIAREAMATVPVEFALHRSG